MISQDIRIEDHPYIAYLWTSRGDWWGSQCWCSGSIISQKHILTSAYCIDDIKSSELKVYTGTNSTKSKGEPHSVKNIWIHEKYRRVINSYPNNIAVIEVFIEFHFLLNNIITQNIFF